MKATWILPDGQKITADVKEGMNLMQAAVANNIPNVIGECGGNLSCATCHVYVDEEWAARLPAPSREEQDMVEGLDQRRASSRLGCQVMVTDALDGLVVTVAAAE